MNEGITCIFCDIPCENLGDRYECPKCQEEYADTEQMNQLLKLSQELSDGKPFEQP